jgi:hypothetical protein
LSSTTGWRFGGVVVALALLPADAYLPPPAAPLPLAAPHVTSAATKHHTYNTLASEANAGGGEEVPGVRRGRASSPIDAGQYGAIEEVQIFAPAVARTARAFEFHNFC